MGLDMYLKCNSRKVCQHVNDMDDEWERCQAEVGTAIQWRKANQVHRWFVNFVQDGRDDCGMYPVSIGDLVNLHDTCVDALENRDRASEILPTQDGFLFGTTEYGNDYWWDVEFTVLKLEKLMEGLTCDKWGMVYHEEEPDWEVRFYYTSSW